MKWDVEFIIACLIFIGIVVLVNKLGWSLGIDVVFAFVIFGYEVHRVYNRQPPTASMILQSKAIKNTP